MRRADRRAKAHEVSWLQCTILIGKYAAHAKSAGPGCDRVVLKVDLSQVWESLLVLQSQVHRRRGAFLAVSGLSFTRELPHAQNGLVVLVEIGVDTAGGDDRCQD